MGTRCDVVFPLLDSDLAEKAFVEIKRECLRIEKKFSCFDKHSIIYQINHKALGQAIKLDTETFRVLQVCLEYNKKTDGYFDITYSSQPTRQTDDKLGLNSDSQTVLLKDKQVKIDLGAIGKGYAIEKIKSILKNKNIENALISMGESSLLAKGTHPYGNCWKIGIQHQYEKGKNAHILELKDETFSTSGNKKENGYEKQHIINPKTGRLTDTDKTVTIVSKSAVEAEIVSTALFCCPENEQKSIVQKFKDINAIVIAYKAQQIVATEIKKKGRLNPPFFFIRQNLFCLSI